LQVFKYQGSTNEIGDNRRVNNLPVSDIHADRLFHIDLRQLELYGELRPDVVVLLFTRNNSKSDEYRKKKVT
jgi:hypothetical protein